MNGEYETPEEAMLRVYRENRDPIYIYSISMGE